MMIQDASNALLYITFPATLCKAAWVWYSRLESRSIHSYKQLAKMFVAFFNANQRIPKEPDSLFSIWQQDVEPLKDYVA